MIKKILLFVVLIFSFNAFSQNQKIPNELKGIWEGDDRFIFFGEEDFALAHKIFYGWYTDISALNPIPEDFSKEKNDASSQKILTPEINFSQIEENIPAWEMTIFFDKKTKSVIPLCIIENQIFLDFYIKSQNEQNQNKKNENLYGFFKGVNTKNTIGLSKNPEKQNISCFYITDSAFYNLHFWQTDMPFTNEKAVFNDKENIFEIEKHIKSAGLIYTCTTGKRKNIRNVEKFTQIPEKLISNEQKNLFSLENAKYKKLSSSTNIDDFLNLVKEQNQKIHPIPKSPFNNKK